MGGGAYIPEMLTKLQLIDSNAIWTLQPRCAVYDEERSKGAT